MELELITGEQIRMAKAALGFSNTDLAKLSGLHKNTINRAENGEAREATFALLKTLLEQSGIEFLPETPTSGPGVRLKKEAV